VRCACTPSSAILKMQTVLRIDRCINGKSGKLRPLMPAAASAAEDAELGAMRMVQLHGVQTRRTAPA
jgi:hypothetical protein